MTEHLGDLLYDLVIANRILAHEDVVDAYGHVSVRHPQRPGRFFLARSLAPELVTPDDIIEFTLDGKPVHEEKRALYTERFIHGSILEARPDVMAVVHAHAEDTLPFGITNATPLRPVIHLARFSGAHIPVWDIADKFGDTDLLVSNVAQGQDLAKGLGEASVVLMRGHGFAAAARSLIEVVLMAVYLARNARVLMRAKQLGGEIKYLTDGEIAARNRSASTVTSPIIRAWEYWAKRAGVGDLLSGTRHSLGT